MQKIHRPPVKKPEEHVWDKVFPHHAHDNLWAQERAKATALNERQRLKILLRYWKAQLHHIDELARIESITMDNFERLIITVVRQAVFGRKTLILPPTE